MNTVPIELLIVEDNPADVYLLEKTLKASKSPINIHLAVDGEQALAFLHREGDFADALRPDVILLDLNLPGIDGREVLAEVKQDAELKTIPVIVLTSSNAEADVHRSYELDANAYLTKPLDLDRFAHLVEAIEQFWFQIVKLPGR